MSQVESAAYDVLPVGVIVIDQSLTVSAWNATIAKWSRVAPTAAIGKRLDDLLPGFDARRFSIRLASVFEQGHSAVLSAAMQVPVFPLTQSSGETLFHKVHASAAPSGAGKALLVIEDVTASVKQLNSLRAERRRLKVSERSLRQRQAELTETNAALDEARARAEKASQAKTEFLANMSHEVRTPLTAIKGFSEAAITNAETPFVRDAIERVARNADHLLAIVNDILDLSKIETGNMRLNLEPCSPAKLVEETTQLLETRANEKRLILETAIGPGTNVEIASDLGRLRQVLVNLIDNAVKFTDAGAIKVAVERVVDGPNGDVIRFTIADTGRGIAAGRLSAVFQPFVQEDASTQREHGGTGLGLAICRQIVEQIGGSIDVESQLGVGTTFVFTIPARSPELSTEPGAVAATSCLPAARTENTLPALHGRRVLVAEDGPDNQLLIEYHLQRAGAELHIVDHGKLAVEAASEESASYDAVLLDMQMPVMDGYTAARRMRDNGIDLPIVALTASAMDGDREKALSAGCDEYLAKPIDAEQLIGLLAERIEQHAGSLVAQAEPV
ncbi:MAG: ATP-binding protein [Planctomycetota bacterium]